jgi:ribosomal-protein-alanine N-acetyltransferase
MFNNNENRSQHVIRECSIEDIEGVIDVNEKELPEDYPYFFYKSILDNFPRSFLVAVDPLGKIAGYIMWRVERIPADKSLKLLSKGHLVSIAVSKHSRRKGIATDLLNTSMPAIEASYITEFVLEVRVSNYGAVNLYKNFGYEVETIKKKYYRDGENAYYMIKKVNKD